MSEQTPNQPVKDKRDLKQDQQEENKLLSTKAGALSVLSYSPKLRFEQEFVSKSILCFGFMPIRVDWKKGWIDEIQSCF